MSKKNVERMLDYDENQMNQTITMVKLEYQKQMLSVPMNGMEFLFQQMILLKGTYWIKQIGILGFAIMAIIYLKSNSSSLNVMSYPAFFSPLLIIFSIPELWRNIETNSIEIENTTYFNLRKVYFARILLVGMFELILVSALTIMTVSIVGTSLQETIIYFFIPFNLICCICFTLLCHKKKVTTETLVLICCGGAAILWYVMVNHYKVYELLQIRIWYVLLLLSFTYILYSIRRVLEMSRNYMEVYECNYK